MKKTLSLILSILVVGTIFAGCGSGQTQTTQTQGQTQAQAAAKDTYNVAVIAKNSQSAYWQYSFIGANNAAVDSNGKIKVTTYGAPKSTDIDKQISIMEDVINNKPDGIVIAASNPDSLAPEVEKAKAAGIKVVLIDSIVNTDKYDSFLATDNVDAGARAAQALVDKLKANNQPLKGKIGLISPYAGVPFVTDREKGFTNKMKEIAPDIQIAGPRYIDNDAVKGVGVVEDMLTANSDLLGFFGSNNMCGTAISRVVTERNLADKTVVVSFDSDPEEISGLTSGSIDALLVQDPYTMGYKGVQSVVEAAQGKTLEKFINTGAQVITKDNMNTKEIKELLDPNLKKK